MVGQGYGNNWVGDDSPAAEAAFHGTLVRLRAEGASNQEIAEAVMRSPFILGLVWGVTAKRQLKTSRGARPPLDWEERPASRPKPPEGGCETLYLLGKRLRTKWDDRCDLHRPRIGGYWRVKIIYAAIKAAWKLFEESRLKVRRSKSLVCCFGDGMSVLPNEKCEEASK